MFKKSLASQIASEMSRKLESDEHKAIFSSPTLNKFAAKKKEDSKDEKKVSKKDSKQNKKEDKKSDKNNCGPMGKGKGKGKGKVKVIKLKKADALRVAVSGIAKISAMLDEMKFDKSSLATLAALDSIVKEAQSAPSDGVDEYEVEEMWKDFSEDDGDVVIDSFTDSAREGLNEQGAHEVFFADDEDDETPESFEDFFKGIVGDEVKDAFTESAEKKMKDSSDVDDFVIDVPETVITPGDGNEMSPQEQEDLMKTLEDMKTEIDADIAEWGVDSGNVDDLEGDIDPLLEGSEDSPHDDGDILTEIDSLAAELVSDGVSADEAIAKAFKMIKEKKQGDSSSFDESFDSFEE